MKGNQKGWLGTLLARCLACCMHSMCGLLLACISSSGRPVSRRQKAGWRGVGPRRDAISDRWLGPFSHLNRFEGTWLSGLIRLEWIRYRDRFIQSMCVSIDRRRCFLPAPRVSQGGTRRPLSASPRLFRLRTTDELAGRDAAGWWAMHRICGPRSRTSAPDPTTDHVAPFLVRRPGVIESSVVKPTITKTHSIRNHTPSTHREPPRLFAWLRGAWTDRGRSR